MDKLYSKSALIYKAVFCLFLTPLCAIIAAVMDIDDSFLYIILSIIPIGTLFTIPYWLSFYNLKKYPSAGIKKYILLDAISCMIPAIFGVLFYEVFHSIFYEKTVATGILTLIMSIVFIIISLISWLMYYIASQSK